MTQAFNLSQLANNLNTSGQLDATDGLTGAVPVANGGTGQSSLSANAVLLGNGTGGVQTVAPSTSGNVLVSNGTTWVSQAPSGGGVTSLNGQTGAITNTDLGAIGSVVVAVVYSSSGYYQGQTIAGSSLYVPNTNAGGDTSRFYSQNSGTFTQTYFWTGGFYCERLYSGNSGVQPPQGCTTLSGTWRVMKQCGRWGSQYNGDYGYTTVTYTTSVLVRVS